MECDTLIITRTDFDGHVRLRESCDFGTLRIYIREAQYNDLFRVMGNAFMLDLVQSIEGDDAEKRALYAPVLDGCIYDWGCNDEQRYNYGLKTALVHYAYAAYVMDSSYVDSPHGMVHKLNQDSIPVQPGDLKNLHDRHIRIASNYIQTVKNYICANKDKFTLYCGDCTEQKLNKVRSSTFKHITR